MFRRWRRKQAQKKIKAGDGHALKKYRFHHLFSRSLFYKKLQENDDTTHTYAVDVNYFNEESTAELYRDGKHHSSSKLPAVFPVPGGVIEVATTTFGLKRMHFINEDNKEYLLSPDRRSTEGLRMRLDARFPKVSSAIAKMAIITLLVSLVLGLPQLVALMTQLDIISEHFGTFESPIVLPDGVNITILVVGTLAAIERALMLRNHWLIDMETSWWDS